MPKELQQTVSQELVCRLVHLIIIYNYPGKILVMFCLFFPHNMVRLYLVVLIFFTTRIHVQCIGLCFSSTRTWVLALCLHRAFSF